MICDKNLSTKLEYISTSYIISDNKLDMITWGKKKCLNKIYLLDLLNYNLLKP